jgi:ABC-type methionine transport system permease subunit
MTEIFSKLLETIYLFFILLAITAVIGFVIGILIYLYSGKIKWSSSKKVVKSDILQHFISLFEFFPFIFDFLIFLCIMLFFDISAVSPFWIGLLIVYSNLPFFINNTYTSLKGIGEIKYNHLVLLGPSKFQLIQIIFRETIQLYVSKCIKSSSFILTSILIIGFKTDIGITHNIMAGTSSDKVFLIIAVVVILLLYLTIYVNGLMVERISKRAK